MAIAATLDEVETSERPGCPWCAATRWRSIGRVRFDPAWAEGFLSADDLRSYMRAEPRLRRCAACAAVWVSPAPTPAALDRLYAAAAAEYFDRFGADATVDPREDGLLAWFGVGPSTRMLDIGAGGGSLVRAAKARGASVSAIEPARYARERLIAGGVPTVAVVEDAPPEWTASFDVVSMMDVLEHLLSPVELLERARRLLAPGGRILAFTGAADAALARVARAAWWYVRIPGHLSIASSRGVRAGARAAGLQARRIHRIPHPPAVPSLSRNARALATDLVRSYGGLPLRVARRRQVYPIALPAGPDHVLVELFEA